MGLRMPWFTVHRNFLPSPYHMAMTTAMKTSSTLTSDSDDENEDEDDKDD